MKLTPLRSRVNVKLTFLTVFLFLTRNQHFLKVTLCEKSTFCCILSEMNIFVVARSRDNKYEFFAYVISQKRRVALRKKLQSSVSKVKRSPHTKIQLFLSTLKMAKKSRGRSCPRPFNWILHCDWLPKKARWHYLTCSGLPTREYLFLYNKCFTDQACSVKMAGYCPCYFYACLSTSTQSRSINKQKTNLANIQPSRPYVWPIVHIYC